MASRKPQIPRELLPWLGLALSLAMVMSTWSFFRRAQLRRIHDRFQAETALLQVRIADRMAAHEQILRGAAEFISQRPDLPSRSEWRLYAQALDLDRLNPGVQALGFAEWIPLQGLDAHVRRLRGEGFPDYEVHPGGPLPPDGGLSSIIYTEPFDERNQRTFSKDMLADATRRKAMVRARDTGLVTLSDKVRLYQEGSTQIQAGTVLYMPIYRRGQPLASVDLRRKAFLGWAYLAFRMQNLLEGILGNSSHGIFLELFDGASEQEADLLYAREGFHSAAGQSWMTRTHLEVAGRVWTLRTSPGTDFGFSLEGTGHYGILALGLLFSGIIFGLLHSFARAERAANAVAEDRLEKLQLLLDSTGEAIYGIDLQGQCTFCNPAFLRMMGFASADQVLGRNMHHLVHHSYEDGSPYPVEVCRIFRAFRQGLAAHVSDEVLWRADGSSFPVEYWSYPQNRKGRIVGAVVAFLDITERKQAEAALRLSQDRLSLALTSSDMGTFEWDIPNDISHFDETVHRLIGTCPEPFTGSGQEFYAAIHPSDREFVRSSLARAMADGHYETEFRTVWPDGSIHHLAAKGRLFMDAQGRPAKLNGVLWDVSQRTLAEEALVRERNFTSALLDNLVESVVACDERGDLVLFNRTAREWHGVGARKIPQEQWSEYYGLFEEDGVTPLATQDIPLARALDGEEVRNARPHTLLATGQPLRVHKLHGFAHSRRHGAGAGRCISAARRHPAATHRRDHEENFRGDGPEPGCGRHHQCPGCHRIREPEVHRGDRLFRRRGPWPEPPDPQIGALPFRGLPGPVDYHQLREDLEGGIPQQKEEWRPVLGGGDHRTGQGQRGDHHSFCGH